MTLLANPKNGETKDSIVPVCDVEKMNKHHS